MNKIISDNTTEIDNVKTVAGVSTREEAVKARGIVSAGTYGDYRTNGHSINSTPTNLSTNPIPAADANNYFYLPALGDYYAGSLHVVGNDGSYWSSSATPWSSYDAYTFGFSSGIVGVSYNRRAYGFTVAALE